MKPPNAPVNLDPAALQARLAETESRLAEAEETLRAIYKHEVDALVVKTRKGEQIFTLKGAETPYRLLLEAMNEGAMTLSKAGTILYCNTRFAQIAKKPMEQIVASTCEQCLAPGEYSAFRKLLRKAKKEGAKGEFTLQTGDGSSLPIEVSVRAMQLEEVDGFSVLVTDITERRLSEQALREANERLEQRVQQRTLELTRANEILRTRSEELASANEALQAQSEELQAQSEALRAAQEQLRVHAEELERQVAERTAHLEATNRSLETVCYNIAHDLRAPHRTMQGFADILLTEHSQSLDETGREYLQRIAAAAKRSDQLILDLLAYARFGHSLLPCRRHSLADSLKTVLEHFESEIKEKKARVKVHAPLPEILANPTALEQALGNLLNNALKFVAPGVTPEVTIWAEESVEGQMRETAPGSRNSEPRTHSVRIWVKDNGIGISPEYHARVFNVFERLHTEGYSGTGIGLAIVQKAVERMNGSVGLLSAPGQGSSFWIELPKP